MFELTLLCILCRCKAGGPTCSRPRVHSPSLGRKRVLEGLSHFLLPPNCSCTHQAGWLRLQPAIASSPLSETLLAFSPEEGRVDKCLQFVSSLTRPWLQRKGARAGAPVRNAVCLCRGTFPSQRPSGSLASGSGMGKKQKGEGK